MTRNPDTWLRRVWLKCRALKCLMSSSGVDYSDFYISPDGAQLALPTGAKKTDLFTEFLGERGIQSNTFKHPPVQTIEDAQKIRRDIPGVHTKALFLRDGENNYFLFVTDGTSPVSLETLSRTINAKGSLCFGSRAALMELLGIKPESLSVLALINDVARNVTVVIDERLMSASVINCRPPTNRRTTSLTKDVLVAFLASTGHMPLFVSLREDG